MKSEIGGVEEYSDSSSCPSMRSGVAIRVARIVALPSVSRAIDRSIQTHNLIYFKVLESEIGGVEEYSDSSSCPSMRSGVAIRVARIVALPSVSRAIVAGGSGGDGPSTC